MTRTSGAARLAALLVLASLAAACGGTASSGAAATPTQGDTTDGTTGGAIPSFDLSALTGAIPGVDSYRVSLSTNGKTQYESVVVTKPEISKAITTYNDDGTVSERIVVIGKDAWTADGADGAFEPVPEGTASSMLLAFDPATMLGAYMGVDWAGMAADQGSQEKNGVQAHHLRIDSTSGVGLAAAMPAGAAIDIWIADAGYLVAWEMSGFDTGEDMSIQVTNVNDGSNKVEAPTS
jgi:hypothetical protein